VGQVARDGPLAEEERGRHLAVRPALRDEHGDPTLRRGQPFLAPSATDAPDLLFRLRDPDLRAELLEAVERRAQRVLGRALLPFPPANDAEREQRTARP
jgi:hypothetical protein